MSLTSPLIEQALAQLCAFSSPETRSISAIEIFHQHHPYLCRSPLPKCLAASQEAVSHKARVSVRPSNCPRWVDAVGIGAGRAGNVEGGESAIASAQEA